MSNKFFSKILHYLILILLTLVVVLPSKDLLFAKTDISYYEKAYSESQYVMGVDAINNIDDDTLYTYAGYAYAKGEDPATINFEHPPLGKYLFGFSYFIFGNSVVINIFIFFLILILLYDLQKLLKIPAYFRYIPLIFISTSGLFLDHMGRALLDLQQLLFTLLFFSVLLRKNSNKYIVLGIILGIIASIKYPYPLIGLYVLMILMDAVLYKSFKKTFISLVIGYITYLSTYLIYFTHNHSLIDYIKFEWYRYRWWTEFRTIPQLLMLNTINSGRFKQWWVGGNYELAKNFTYWWKTLFTLNFLSIPYSLVAFPRSFYLIIYSTILLFMYLFGSAHNERYLIQLIPFWTINITIGLVYLQSRIKTKTE